MEMKLTLAMLFLTNYMPTAPNIDMHANLARIRQENKKVWGHDDIFIGRLTGLENVMRSHCIMIGDNLQPTQDYELWINKEVHGIMTPEEQQDISKGLKSFLKRTRK